MASILFGLESETVQFGHASTSLHPDILYLFALYRLFFLILVGKLSMARVIDTAYRVLLDTHMEE